MKSSLSLSLLNSRKSKTVFRLALIFFGVSFLVFVMNAQAAENTSAKNYWKTYFTKIEADAVKKNAENYVLSEIKKKSDSWKGVFSSFHLKKGSINDQAVKDGGLGTDKIRNLDSILQEKLSSSGGTLSGVFNWAAGQTFSADNLTGSYAALNGSQITGLTASQVGAIPYSGATSSVDLNGKDLVNVGNVGIGTPGSMNTLTVNGEVAIKELSGNAVAVLGSISPNGSAPYWYLGTKTSSGDDSAILIGRALTGGLGETGAHGVRDESLYNTDATSGLRSYASFDAIPKYSGSANFGHYAGFQSRFIYNGTGSITTVNGYTSYPVINGTVNSNQGMYIHDALGTGTITNNTGIFIEPLTRGATNYAIYTSGTTPSVFGGTVHVWGNLPVIGTITGGNLKYDYSERNLVLGSATKSGLYNTFIGAGTGGPTGMYNTLVGSDAGSALSTGATGNTFIGSESGRANNGSGSVFLGKYAGRWETGSNKLFIDNAQRTDETDARVKALMYGVFDADPANQKLTVNGKVGIGTTSPAATLDVNGEVKLKKDSSQPYACDATYDGTIALTSGYRTCVCKGGSTTWVFTSDGTTTCTW